MGGSDFAVAPSALDTAAVSTRAVGDQIRAITAELIAPVGSSIGDVTCGHSLIAAQKLLGQACVATASGVLALSRALNEAGDAYSLADGVAVPYLPRS